MNNMQRLLWSTALRKVSRNLDTVLTMGVSGVEDKQSAELHVLLAEVMGVADWLRRDLIESQLPTDDEIPF